MVPVRRENRVPLELLASRFGVTSHCRNILEHIMLFSNSVEYVSNILVDKRIISAYLYFWVV